MTFFSVKAFLKTSGRVSGDSILKAAAMIPVGGYYTIDGRQAADLVFAIKPRIVIPMHYRDDQAGFGYREIDTEGSFVENMDNVMTIPASEIDTDDELCSQVVVMKSFRVQER